MINSSVWFLDFGLVIYGVLEHVFCFGNFLGGREGGVFNMVFFGLILYGLLFFLSLFSIWGSATVATYYW